MPNNAIMSTGTKLEIKTSANASYIQVKGLKSFTGPGGGSSSVQDVTDLDSTAKEKLVGLADEGQVKCSFNLIPNDPGQLALQAARKAQEIVGMKITLGKATKTYNANALVLTAEISGGVDAPMSLESTLEITGDVTQS